MRYVISTEQSGKAIKSILCVDLGLSSAFIKHLKFIENGILLNGEHATVRKKVEAGDILELATEDTDTAEHLTPSDIPLEIAYEDGFVIIPNKPPFMPTHPSHLHHGDTLADALAFIYKKSGKPFVFRPVNRLDRNTSGLTLIAKDRISASKLAKAMKDGKINKQYLAVLDGELSNDEGIIEGYLRRTEKSVIVREVCDENGGGDYALTRYKVLMRKDGHSLVLASPITGRTHQLRVHFASLSCPIVGDDMYGTADSRIPRHALHALSLSFPHPETEEYVSVKAELPSDMQEIILSIFGAEALNNLIKKEK